MQYEADFIFFNGPVVTVNSLNEIAEAVVVKGNRIIFVGNYSDARIYGGRATVFFDLKGRSLLPGFIDSHIHFGMFGLKQGPIVDINFEKAHSIKKIKQLIHEETKNKMPGQWIVCWGYDQNKLEEGRHPTVDDFDEVSPQNPVRCTRCCGHMGVYNSLALEMLGIGKRTDFADGEVVTEDGRLTGLLKENAHMYAGQLAKFSEEEILAGIMLANKEVLKLGITTVHDAGSDGTETIRIIEKAVRDKQIQVRIHQMIFDLAGKEQGKELIKHYLATGLSTGFGNEMFTIGPVKIMLDGSSSGPSSAMSKPYNHDSNLKGILVWTQEEADEVIIEAHNAGYQVTAHAIGDLAIDIILKAIEKALKNSPRMNHRHRIEHCGLPNTEQLDKIKELGIIPIPNPGFIYLNGKDYNRFYGERVDFMFPLKTYIQKGIIAAIGSDTPVIEPNPMHGIYGALMRTDGKTNEYVGKQQCITVLDAVRMYTYNGAFASFEENNKGSIEPGKLADLIVLSKNILETRPESIKEVKTDITMIDGQIVYERDLSC